MAQGLPVAPMTLRGSGWGHLLSCSCRGRESELCLPLPGPFRSRTGLALLLGPGSQAREWPGAQVWKQQVQASAALTAGEER